MKALVVAHVGETFGHLIKAVAVTKSLVDRGISVEIAVSRKASAIRHLLPSKIDLRYLSWNWSHNSFTLESDNESVVVRVLASVRELWSLMQSYKPAIVIGLPGLASAQVARSLGIPHYSVLHGPYLSPLVETDSMSELERRIIDLARRVCQGPVSDCLSAVGRQLALPGVDYQTYLRTENVFVVQPGLPLSKQTNFREVGFIRGSLGDGLDDGDFDFANSCYVSFGSGNPCEISRVLRLTREIYRNVITTTVLDRHAAIPDGVFSKPFIASTYLAGRVSATVNHGGIGTVAVFAEARTPQLIIPTELDQATMAVHAARAGIAQHCGLETWLSSERTRAGRRLPEFSDREFLDRLSCVETQYSPRHGVRCTGADDIADAIVRESCALQQSIVQPLRS